MTNKKELVDNIFQQIKEETTIEGLEAIKENKQIVANKFDTNLYPPIKFDIKTEDINAYVDINGGLNADAILKKNDPIINLLYAALWKQGDIPKVKHLVQGIREAYDESDSDKNSALVFYQFGRHLASKDEIIIDQHVIRAYAVYEAQEANDIEKALRIGSITSSKYFKDRINKYKEWVEQQKERITRENKIITREGIAYAIDHILFATGKTIKQPKNNKS